MSKEPALNLYTMNRDITIASTSGHSIAFTKNKPQHVPKIMQAEVLKAGGVPADPDSVVHDDQIVKEDGVAPMDPDERNEMILMAVQEIRDRDERESFTATGFPKTKVVEKALGFPVSAAEVAEQWSILVSPKD